MSINVNVSGNPVLIKNGKMVNGCDKGEFDRRRLMRLQQVRQQSKIIAENVRNKVRHPNKTTPTTTTTQQSDFEQKSEEQLQCWQAKRLLELQNQYQNALCDIGLGHRQVDSVISEEAEFNQQQQINETVAEERGRNALDKVQIERNKKNIKKAIPIQRKKIVRDMENERAANLQKVQQKKSIKTKKKSTSDGTEKDKENRTVEELDLQQKDESTPPNTAQEKPVVCKEIQTSPSLLEDAKIKDKFVQTSEIIQTPEQQEYFKDTRISERMKRRQLPDPIPEICKDTNSEDDCSKIKSYIKPKIVCCHHCQCVDEKNDEMKTQISIDETRKNDEIPIKSKIKLKSTQKSDNLPTTTRQPTKCRICSNLPSAVHVDRIEDGDFTTSLLSDDREFDEKLQRQQQQKQAKLRGKKALEREHITRDYQELLHKLPVLQKQENLLDSKKKNNEKFHMSEERLKEFERRKQNQLDNVYERLFVNEPKSTIITLPRKQDLPHWDTDTNQQTTNTNLQDELKRLLDNLQQQKDELLRENVEEIRRDDKKRKRTVTSPNSSDNDVNNMENKTTQTKLACKKIKTRPKRDRDVIILQNTSTQTTPKIEIDIATSPIIKNQIDERQQETYTKTHIPCTCDITTTTKQIDPYEIVIKVQQDYRPTVVASPPTKIVTKQQQQRSRKSSINKNLPWRQQLSQNSSLGTTPTSYLSPPNFSKSSSLKSSDNDSTRTKSFVKFSKRIEAKIDGNLDPRLLKYIQKLLDSTSQHIDNLSTSSPSDVSTPSQSTIDIPSNNTMKQLKNVMKYFNLTSSDIKNALNSNRSQSTHYNTSESSVEKVQIDDNGNKQTSDSDKYTEIVEKIANLTDMINEVRAEKQKILQETSRSNDARSNDARSNDARSNDARSSDGRSNDSAIHEEALKKLLEIDLSFAQKLKKFPPRQLEQENVQAEMISDEELLARYRRLLEIPTVETNEKQKEDDTVDIPIALNIEKLPKFESIIMNQSKSKPPPSKALLKGPQELGVPHELSTILEADSQLSTKLDQAQFIKTMELRLSNENSERSDIEDAMEEMLKSIGMAWAIPTLRKTRETLTLASSSSIASSSSSSSSSNKADCGTSCGTNCKSKTSLKSFLTKQCNWNECVDNQHLTSTPIVANQTGGDLFVGETELSSVQEDDYDQFHSLGNTANTSSKEELVDNCNCGESNG